MHLAEAFALSESELIVVGCCNDPGLKIECSDWHGYDCYRVLHNLLNTKRDIVLHSFPPRAHLGRVKRTCLS